jgi:hypothetical protein
VNTTTTTEKVVATLTIIACMIPMIPVALVIYALANR